MLLVAILSCAQSVVVWNANCQRVPSVWDLPKMATLSVSISDLPFLRAHSIFVLPFLCSYNCPPSSAHSRTLVVFSFPALLPDQLNLNDLPTSNLCCQGVVIAIEPQDPRLPLSVIVPALGGAAFLVLLIQVLDFLDRNKALPAFERESLVNAGAVPGPDNVALRGCFVAVAELVRVVVDKNPIQLWGLVAYGGDESFTSATPGLLRVG